MHRRFAFLYKIAHFEKLAGGEAGEMFEAAMKMALVDEAGLEGDL